MTDQEQLLNQIAQLIEVQQNKLEQDLRNKDQSTY